MTDVDLMMTPEDREKFERGAKLLSGMRTRQFLSLALANKPLPNNWNEEIPLSIEVLRDVQLIVNYLIMQCGEKP